jgi:glycosyltransferase involved in cell wall biosynthesis
LRTEVEARAAALGVSERIRVLGYVEDIASWYAAFDVFLLVSANEGTPVVAIEALAAAIPVVATDAGGTRAVVDDGETGFLASVGDTEALAAHVRRLLAAPELRLAMGAEGARRMRERFSISRMADDIDRLYRGILDR